MWGAVFHVDVLDSDIDLDLELADKCILFFF